MSQTAEGPNPSARPRKSRAALGAALVIAIVLGGGVLYGFRTGDKESAAACPASAALAAKLNPLVHGEVAALALAKAPHAMPNLTFQGDGGAPKTLADFKGRTVLLNLWATWCVPCRKEMPALDKLQARLGGPDFQVVAVNVDTAKLDRPRKFLADVAATSLPFYADPDGTIFNTMREQGPVMGLPTTFLLDRNGCAVGTMAGPAEWDSADAEKLIEAAKS